MKRFFARVSVAFLLAFVLVFSSCDAGANTDWRDLTVRHATGTKGVVATANAYASKVGLDILKAGGNAFDAAVAVGFAIGVVEPNASGVGGGGLMVAYEAETDKNWFYNFREFSPKQATTENMNKPDGIRFDEGIGASGVPTQVAGMLKIHQNLGSGKLTRQQVIAPAIELAEQGFVIDDSLASALRGQYIVGGDQQIKSIFTDGFSGLEAGETLIQENYAAVLKEIAQKGNDGFYKGWVADALIKAHSDRDGLLTQEDLDYAQENFPRISNTLKSTYNGFEIHTADAPSVGGVGLIECLNMLEHYSQKPNNTPLKDIDHNSAEYLHIVSTAMQISYGNRSAYADDYTISPLTNQPFTSYIGVNNNGNPLPALVSKGFAKDSWEGHTNGAGVFVGYDKDSSFATTEISPTSPNSGASPIERINKHLSGTASTSGITIEQKTKQGSSTTTFSIADSHGNIVTITQTINYFWGFGIMPENTGFFLNNNLKDSTSGIAPYKQPISSMAPTIIMKDGLPFATLGTPGGMRIMAVLLQVALNVMDFDMDIQAAIEQPRIYTESGVNREINGVLRQIMEVEATGKIIEAIPALKALNYAVGHSSENDYTDVNLYFGGVQGIKFNYNASGKLVNMTGGADTRRDGKSLAW